MVVIQGSQGGKEARFLVCNRALRQRHSNLLAFLYFKARGPEKPMHGIMKHALEWCK
jgi:hypothetical protein